MEPFPHRDRYDVSGNVEAQYADAAGAVLVNKLGIADLYTIQVAEESGLALAYETLTSEIQIDTPMSCDILRMIHARIFGDLYAWAGKWRTVQISKPGAIWPAAQYLDQSMAGFECDVLKKYPARVLETDDAFCAAIGEIQGEFLAIHPFREGNARTVKLMSNLLASQTGRRFLIYDDSTAGVERYITAASAALLKKDYQPMIQIIRVALARSRARRGPATV